MNTITAGNGSNVLFISHNAADRPFAVAIKTAIRELLDSDALIDVRFSTSEETGPQGGEEWRNWIYRQVVEARTVLIVVTPHALGKPWLLWEAGACRGAALAQQAAHVAPTDSTRLYVSIAYGLADSECPEPLRGDQIIAGENRDKVELLLRRIMESHEIPTKIFFKAGTRMSDVLRGYLEAVRTAVLRTPSLVTEANVQDWLDRLEKLVHSDRLSELKGFQRWMTLAFGRDGETAGIPIDVRLHRRIGELHLAQKDFAAAVEQLQLARRAAPRDIYVLRPLVEATMKGLLAGPADDVASKSQKNIESLLEAIKELDPDALVSTPDSAALFGKYLRTVEKKPDSAAEVFATALKANPNSYYLADLLAQTQLELRRSDEAKGTYRQAISIIERLGENNLWSHATAATAHLALGEIDRAHEHVVAIGKLGPISRAEVDTICSGLRHVAERSGIAQSAIDKVLTELQPTL